MSKNESNIKKNKKNKKNSFRRFMTVTFMGIFSVLIIGVTSYTTLKYWVEIYSKYRENKELSTKLSQLKKREEVLRVDINKMQDSDYIARYAREKYLYSKDGEFILNIK